MTKLSFAARLTRFLLKTLYRPIVFRSDDVNKQRRLVKLAGSVLRVPRQITIDKLKLGDVATTVYTPPAITQPPMLLLHGGAYVLGGDYSHKEFAANLASNGECQVYLPDYRMAPEHPYPAALDDALTCWKWLLEQHDDRPSLAGDSAGAGLSMSLQLALKTQALPLPNRTLLLSPFVDLTFSGASLQSKAAEEVMLTERWVRNSAHQYLAGRQPTLDPLLHPTTADLSEFPPTLVLCGSCEILLDDSRSLVQQFKKHGVAVEYIEAEGMWHDWPLFARLFPEGQQTMHTIAEFLTRQTPNSNNSN